MITVNDTEPIITFMNKYGQFLMIPKNKCDINTSTNTTIQFYNCKMEPNIAYCKPTSNKEIFIRDNMLSILQTK